jgi:2-polyprenyl-3-methyl-5-hydroxy-6-metoxy-1,4-benzoquinol methylase
MNTPVLEQQRYYNTYWANHAHQLNSHEIIRLAEILKGIARISAESKKTNLRICDLGCGRGWLSQELSKFGSVVGVDLSDVGIAAAQERWPDVDFRVYDITKWRPDEKFDVVISSEVIEHVPDQVAFADTVQHLLREGGYLLITTPNGKVKKAWDRDSQGAQLVEKWLTCAELRTLFTGVEPILHKTFIYDFSYSGIFRITSAPKLLKSINSAGLLPVYDAMRELMNFGLYQILVGKYEPRR